MAENSAVYPVGLYYVGPSAAESQTTQPNGSDDRTIVVPDQMLPDEIKVKQEEKVDVMKADHEFSKIENQKEDRNSESYWEKRKRFTLAFAAGLRKFIQVHPELLRYGPKKNQGSNASATVTSIGTDNDEMARAAANYSPTPIDLNPTINITPIDSVETVVPSRSRRPQRNAAMLVAIKQETGDDDDNDEDYSPSVRATRGVVHNRARRGRRMSAPRSNSSTPRKRTRLNSQQDMNEQVDSPGDTSYDIPVAVTIKEEPPDDEDND